MANVTLIVSSLLSGLYRSMFFATQLAEAGHKITFVAPEGVKDIIEQNGFDFRAMPDPWVNPFTSPLQRPTWKDRLSLARRRARTQAALAHYNVDGLAPLLASDPPDLVMLDAELHAHIIVALGQGHRVALIGTLLISAPSVHSPPLHFPQVPGRGWTGSRYAVAAAWAYVLLRKRAVFLRNALRDWGGDQRSVLRNLARNQGVALRALRRINSWPMPWSYRLPTLLLLPEALDLPKRNWPEQHFVGGRTAVRKTAHGSTQRGFDTFPEAQGGSKNIRILMTFGSFLKPNARVVRALFKAVADHPEWHVLFVVKEKFTAMLPPTPKNMKLVAWASIEDLMGQADVVIHHGGIATTLEAIEAQVPSLIYPINNDQYGQGARVAYHNLGILGQPRDSAERIADHIDALIHDPGITSALAEMQQACRYELETNQSARVVADLLGAGAGAS